jgi:hypothetical protein
LYINACCIANPSRVFWKGFNNGLSDTTDIISKALHEGMVLEPLCRIAPNKISNAAVARISVQDGPIEDSDQAFLDGID